MVYNLPEPAGGYRRRSDSAARLAAGATLLLLFGCAAPGVPVTRQPTVPRAITDLSAKQVGDAVVLSFTLPKNTVEGRALPKPPAIEIYRTFGRAQATAAGPEPEQPQLLTAIPPQMVDRYRKGDQAEFPDVLTLADLAAHVDREAAYVVRTRLGKHDSSDSNTVQVLVLPALKPVEDLRAQITETAVQLSWTTPAPLLEGSRPPIALRYRIYRADVSAPGNRSAAASSGQADGSAQTVLLGESARTSYGDSNFAFGHGYAYSVRSIATYENGSVESDESNVLEVTPRDTFAPASPENVTATATPDQSSVAPHVDLSWAISTESDLLGYNVYRSDADNATGARLNPAPLITPAFRDTSVVPGKQYFYRVTAVDRDGNESAPSAPVTVTVPIPARNEPG